MDRGTFKGGRAHGCILALGFSSIASHIWAPAAAPASERARPPSLNTMTIPSPPSSTRSVLARDSLIKEGYTVEKTYLPAPLPKLFIIMLPAGPNQLFKATRRGFFF